MCKQLGAQVLLVANLLGDDENNLEMIRHFKSKGVEIAGIELGNEIYLDSYRPSFPTPASYVARARRAAEHIRKEFPELKIGIVAAGSAEIKKLSMKQKFFFSQWNDKIAAEDFYDAFITHIYSKNAQCDLLKSHEKFECYLKQNSVFTEQAKQAINGMSTLFKGKKAWVTEWNMKDKDQVIGNTGLQAMFYADFQLMLA